MCAPVTREAFDERLAALKEQLDAAGSKVPDGVSEDVLAMDADQRSALCAGGMAAAKASLTARLAGTVLPPVAPPAPVLAQPPEQPPPDTADRVRTVSQV